MTTSTPRTSAYRATLQWITVGTFLAALLAPGIVMITGLDRRAAAGENRSLAATPAISDAVRRPGPFLFSLKAYIQDHFGFRSRLVRLHSALAMDVLGSSPSTNVLLGREGWLFQSSERVVDDYRRVRPWTEDEAAAWAAVFEARRAWLADLGIEYFVTIAPNTHTIYSKYLPPAVRQLPLRPSRLEQLVAALARTQVRVIDVRGPLAAASESDRLYHRTDTHWNDRGAFIAAETILDAIRRDLPSLDTPRLSLAAFEPVTEDAPGGDLAGLIGRADRMTEQWLRLRPRSPRRAVFEPSLAEQDKHFRVIGDQSHVSHIPGADDLARAVVMRDSFGTALMPFLAESFGRVRFEWVDEWFDQKAVEQEQPQVVIQEITERFLMRPPPGAFGRR